MRTSAEVLKSCKAQTWGVTVHPTPADAHLGVREVHTMHLDLGARESRSSAMVLIRVWLSTNRPEYELISIAPED